MLPTAAVLALVQLRAGEWCLWWRPLGLVALSYLLQWIGHHVEGNDMGEVILVRRWLGKPYVAVAPRRSTCSANRADGASPRTDEGT